VWQSEVCAEPVQCHWGWGYVVAAVYSSNSGIKCARSLRCHNIAEAEAAVSVNEEKWLVMHVHVQLRLDELRPDHCV
jgi:hypothetical protein